MFTLFGYIVLSLLSLYQLLTSFMLLFVPRRFRSKKDIKGQRILITGAGSGIGRQLALEFSKHATYLILVDINRQSLLETKKILDPRSIAFIYDCDVSDYEKVYEMAEKVKEEAGDVDILVNNAGIVSGEPLLDLSEEKIVKNMEVNTLAHFWICKAFLPNMMARNSGHIVAISSILGHTGVARLTDYCASKYAAIGFAEALESEMHVMNLNGIKVTIVCPSYVETGLFKGFKTSLTSPLAPEYVAQEIVEGVLEEMETIYIPYYLNYLAMLKSIVPRRLTRTFFELTGNMNMMENFIGRMTDPHITN